MFNKIQHGLKQSGEKIFHGILRLSSKKRPYSKTKNAVIAVNMYPAFGSWGGSSVFLKQFVEMMKRCGFRIVFDLSGKVDAIFLIDPRDNLQKKAFGMEEIRSYRRRHPSVKIIHRINECDQRKQTHFMDDLLKEANEISDYTVFISRWLKEYFVKRWFDPIKPHCIIYNGADPKIFHPIGGNIYQKQEKLRLVTHHWSPNPMKGFPVYKRLDEMIAENKVRDVELWVIGQWPANLHWKNANTFPPASGKRLAKLLRQCHAYITASLWEPCGMHHVEGAQCGLPLLYHEDGGGIVEAGEKYGVSFREENLLTSLENLRKEYIPLRRRLFDSMPSGLRMTAEYVRVIQRVLSEKN